MGWVRKFIIAVVTALAVVGLLMVAKPGWDSLKSVSTWHAFFEVGGIAALAILLFMELGAFAYGDRLSRLEKEQHAAEVAAAAAAAELRYGPRQLTPANAALVRRALESEPTGEVVIAYTLNDPETKGYVDQIAKVLLESKWGVRVDGRIYVERTIEGVTLEFVSAERSTPTSATDMLKTAPSELAVLDRALQAGGIVPKLAWGPMPSGAKLELVIGQKAPPAVLPAGSAARH